MLFAVCKVCWCAFVCYGDTKLQTPLRGCFCSHASEMNFRVSGKSSEDTAVVPCCDKVVPSVRSFVIALISLYTSFLLINPRSPTPSVRNARVQKRNPGEVKHLRMCSADNSATTVPWHRWVSVCWDPSLFYFFLSIFKGLGGALHGGGHLKNCLNNYTK